MIDLVCLVADKNMQAVVEAVLARPRSPGMREIESEIVVHPNRDPGCYHHSDDLLAGYRDQAQKAFVLLDRAWDGAPSLAAEEMETRVEERLRTSADDDWAKAIVIDPELEVWVFSDSPHVATALGFDDFEQLRSALESRGEWPSEAEKPADPKKAVESALRRKRTPRSSAVYRDLAGRVSLRRCQDRSFRRFVGRLQTWFPEAGG
jgi:hypothetical protein